ncbi:WbqC family protein [Azospirillum sp. sgz302134]
MAGRCVVAIHQPNFLPWLGFFDKIARADIFVVLDNVALQRTGGNYTNHVRILMGGRPAWITVPVVRGEDARSRIDQARIAENGVWRRKLIRAIEQNYARTRCFAEVFPALLPLLETDTSGLRDFNLAGIRGLCAMMGVDAGKLVLASELPVEGRATDLLAGIVKAVGGTTYLVGGGAGGYQEDAVFAAAGIDVLRQDFVHPRYEQRGSENFVAGLSIVDALMNCGPAAVARMLGGGPCAY